MRFSRRSATALRISALCLSSGILNAFFTVVINWRFLSVSGPEALTAEITSEYAFNSAN